MITPLHRIRALLALALVATALSVGSTSPAHAGGKVTVTNDQGTSQADSRYTTTFTVRGSGFQTVQGGFGGVYLMFGWVSSGNSWKPSKGGVTGTDYRYIPDSESSNNHGYMKFIAFPGSSTESEAHAVLTANGSFELELKVPGPKFNAVDRDGTSVSVDCLKVTCGIITIGAHGVKNTNNETFTPISFGEVYGQDPGSGEETDDTADETPATTTQPQNDNNNQSTNQPGNSQPKRTGKPKVTTDRATAAVGNALAFTASGFLPGEQVIAILDNGRAAVGPMIAGNNGEIAGVLQLPADLPVGTHELRLTGAASGAQPSERFPVRAAEGTSSSSADSDNEEFAVAGVPLSTIFLGIAILAFAIAAGLTLFRFRRSRKKKRQQSPTATPGLAGGQLT